MKFEITDPCDENWDEMESRAGGRFCHRCETVVVDLAGLTRAQAERRIAAVKGTEVCVQLGLDRFDNAIFQRPAPSRAPHFVGGLVLVAALSAAGCDTQPTIEMTTEVVPESAPGPAMVPVGTDDAGPFLPAPATAAVPTDELNPPEPNAVPTAAQQEQTRLKHRPPVRMVRGRMPRHRR